MNMQTIAEVMTRQVQVVSPQESLQRAAQLMDELNVGALPVCNGERLVGMVTDRDITIRGSAAGRLPQEAHVDEVMSADVRWCFDDQSLDEVMIQMADSQLRRIPVVSHDDQKTLVGIVALGDLATKTADGAQKQDVQDVVGMVSSPTASGGGPAAPVDSIVGHTGEGNDGGAADLGAVGASGQPRDGGEDEPVRTGATADPRKTSGVGGPDLSADGLPPA
jgi:CBS domain-containing protein